MKDHPFCGHKVVSRGGAVSYWGAKGTKNTIWGGHIRQVGLTTGVSRRRDHCSHQSGDSSQFVEIRSLLEGQLLFSLRINLVITWYQSHVPF